MYNLEDLKNELSTGEYGDQFTDYNDGYICDIISEIADSNISIYNHDLWEWAKDNEEWIGEALSEGLYSIPRDSNDFDLMRLFQSGMYVYNQHDLYENLDDSIKYFLYDYIICTHKMTEIDDNLSDFIDEICDNVDNNKQLEDFTESIDDYLDKDSDEEE